VGNSITSFVVHIRDPSQDTNGNWFAMTQSLARLSYAVLVNTTGRLC